MKPLACKLTSPELRKRKEEVISKIKMLEIEKKEYPDGYAYRFNGNNMTAILEEFIEAEKQCCEFMECTIAVTTGETWLRITGPEGVKEFLDKELEL